MRLYPALLLLVIILACPGLVWAQASISGQAQDSVTHKPLAFASVFLANTTLGVTTTEQGEFVFPKVPAGTYDVVGSYVGYRLAKQSIIVSREPQKVILKLGPTSNRLSEVVVRPNPNRAAYYRRFVELFLGHTTFSRQCRIRNPDDVLVDYDPKENKLTASSYKFVQVDNQALGYRIKYYGLRFNTNFKTSIMTFYGQPVFEEMTPRNGRQQRVWETNREKAYRGSLTHFLKCVLDNRLTAEGFLVQRLRVVPNPRFARADSLRRKLNRERYLAELTKTENDSLARWRQEPRAYSMLYTAPRPVDSLRRVVGDGSQVLLRFTDYLQVTYLREAPDPFYAKTTSLSVSGTDAPVNRQVSQLKLLVPEAEIQPNGQLPNPLAVFTDEYWGFEKMGEFLPVNYLPPAPKPAP